MIDVIDPVLYAFVFRYLLAWPLWRRIRRIPSERVEEDVRRSGMDVEMNTDSPVFETKLL